MVCVQSRARGVWGEDLVSGLAALGPLLQGTHFLAITQLQKGLYV